MNIEETIEQAAKENNVPLRHIRRGSFRTPQIVNIREQIVAAFPEAHPRELAEALNMDRSSIYVIRDRIRRKNKVVNTVNHAT